MPSYWLEKFLLGSAHVKVISIVCDWTVPQKRVVKHATAVPLESSAICLCLCPLAGHREDPHA